MLKTVIFKIQGFILFGVYIGRIVSWWNKWRYRCIVNVPNSFMLALFGWA